MLKTMLALMVAVPAAAQAVPLYVATDIGIGVATATGINDSNQIVGYTGISTQGTGFSYKNGVATTIGTLGGSYSRALAVNGVGQIAGTSTMSTGYFGAFLETGITLKNIGTLRPGGGATISATAVNTSGMVAGLSGTNPNGFPHAFYYDGTTMSDLGTLGGTTSSATGINDSNVIVGTSKNASGQGRAFVYSGGVMSDLGTLGGTTATANAISNAGVIAGAAGTSAGYTHAFTDVNNVMTDLGTLTGKTSVAYAINAAGLVVGYATNAAGASVAFVYSGGAMTDLNADLTASLPTVLTSAVGINGVGNIVAAGADGHVYLLTAAPQLATSAGQADVPEADGTGLTAMAAMGALAFLRRKAGRRGHGATAG